MDNRDSFGSRRNLDVVSAVTESRPKPCFAISAVTETKNIASFGAVTETEFRSVSRPGLRLAISTASADHTRGAENYERENTVQIAGRGIAGRENEIHVYSVPFEELHCVGVLTKCLRVNNIYAVT